MSITNITPNAGASSLLQTLFRNADRNGDNQLSADEFRSALDALLTDIRSAASPRALSATRSANAAAGAPAALSTDGLPYAPVAGFVLEKLQNESHVTEKYSSSARLFSKALAATGAGPTAAGLQQVADWLNAHGATATVNKDRLSINGDEPVDVIIDYEGPGRTWWFNNVPQKV